VLLHVDALTAVGERVLCAGHDGQKGQDGKDDSLHFSLLFKVRFVFPEDKVTKKREQNKKTPILFYAECK
jgi:hypothetical protein